jgi:hypothetical protein
VHVVTTRRAATPGGGLVREGVTLDLAEAEARAMIAAGDAVPRDADAVEGAAPARRRAAPRVEAAPVDEPEGPELP